MEEELCVTLNNSVQIKRVDEHRAEFSDSHRNHGGTLRTLRWCLCVFLKMTFCQQVSWGLQLSVKD